MKIINVTVLNDGMTQSGAEALWDKIEKFASYSFCAAHATEYSLISYWTMWVRTYYPAEYFAACLSIVKEEKLPQLVADAREAGIEIFPPDINLSSDRFVVKDAQTILAPFSSVMNCSETTAKAIMKLREEAGGRFTSFEHFKSFASMKGSRVNARVASNLDRAGAFASIEPGQPDARDESRRKDQSELMRGLIIDVVKADRRQSITTDVNGEWKRICSEMSSCRRCSLCEDTCHPVPLFGGKRHVRYMVVFDAPTAADEARGVVMSGKSGETVSAFLKERGISMSEGYFTTLMKAQKPQTGQFTTAQMKECVGYLDAEVKLLKPPVILCLGSQSVRHFLPDEKPSDMIGKSVYLPSMDTTIICGFTPGRLYFNPEMRGDMEAVFDLLKTALK